MKEQIPAGPPSLYRLRLPDVDKTIEGLHAALADIPGFEGVVGDRGWFVVFKEKPRLSVAKQVLARVRRPR